MTEYILVVFTWRGTLFVVDTSRLNISFYASFNCEFFGKRRQTAIFILLPAEFIDNGRQVCGHRCVVFARGQRSLMFVTLGRELDDVDRRPWFERLLMTASPDDVQVV